MMSTDELLSRSTDWHNRKFYPEHRDLDFLGNLRITSLLAYVQETSSEHAIAIGAGFRANTSTNMIWVLSRLELIITGPLPTWMEEITVKTAPVGFDKVLALRDLVFFDKHQRAFALARTAWALVDSEKRSLVRPQILAELFASSIREPLDLAVPSKLKASSFTNSSRIPPVGYRDLDTQGHVNNVIYIDLVLDAYSKQWWESRSLSGIKVNYTEELVWGDEIIHEWQNDGLVHVHGIKKEGSETYAALVELQWKEIN